MASQHTVNTVPVVTGCDMFIISKTKYLHILTAATDLNWELSAAKCKIMQKIVGPVTAGSWKKNPHISEQHKSGDLWSVSDRGLTFARQQLSLSL